MSIRHTIGLITRIACCVLFSGCHDSSGDISIQGAGATFPAPIYKRWFLDYCRHHSNIRVNYQPIGSGAGVRQFTEGLIEFGATDALIPEKEAMSNFKNVEFGLKLKKYPGDIRMKVEQTLRAAALWDEVKDQLHDSAMALSGVQQQRLSIARAIAIEPEVLLMDEPCSALDPIATEKIEKLIMELKKKYTIAIVTHNLAQAKRTSDFTGVFAVENHNGLRCGSLLEIGTTDQIFSRPSTDQAKKYLESELL